MTVDESPFKIDAEAAEEALKQSPEPSDPQPVDPIGKFNDYSSLLTGLRKFIMEVLPRKEIRGAAKCLVSAYWESNLRPNPNSHSLRPSELQ